MPPQMCSRRISRRHAAIAGHEGDTDTARRLLANPAPSVRATALSALARARQLRGVEIAAAVADPSPVVRRRTAELSPRMTFRIRPSLLALLRDPDPTVVETAAWAAGEIHAQRLVHDLDETRPASPSDAWESRPVPTRLIEALRSLATEHDDPLAREAAVAALGSIGDERGLTAILAATHDKPAVRRRAVIALASFSGRTVDDALHRARGDRDTQVRQAAEDLLER